MTQRVRSLFTSTGVWQSSLTVLGTIMAMGISAVAMILISRYLGPAKFGQFSVGFSLLLVVAQLSDFGFNFSLNKLVGETTDQNKINRLFSQATRLKLVLVLIAGVGGWLLAPFLSHILKLPSSHIVQGVFLLLVATLAFDQFLFMLRSIHNFYSAVALSLLQATLKIIGIAFLIGWGVRSAELTFYWYALAPGIPVLLAPFIFPKWLKLTPWKNFVSEHRQLISLVKHMVVFLLAMTLIDNGDILFISAYLPEVETGLYAGVSRIALLVTFAAYSLGMVLNPRVARYKLLADLKNYWHKAWLIGAGSLVAFLFFIPLAKLSILVTVGPEYMTGLSYLIFLVLASFLVFATVPFTALFYSFNKLHFFSVVGIIQIGLMIVGNMWLLPVFGLWGAVWVKLAIRIVTLLLTITWAYFLMKEKE